MPDHASSGACCRLPGMCLPYFWTHEVDICDVSCRLPTADRRLSTLRAEAFSDECGRGTLQRRTGALVSVQG